MCKCDNLGKSTENTYKPRRDQTPPKLCDLCMLLSHTPHTNPIKTTTMKMRNDVAQLPECLPNMHKALGLTIYSTV